MASIYILIILLFRVVQAFFNKRSSNEISGIPDLIRYNAYKNTISATLGLILILGGTLQLDLLTVLLATFSGLSLFAGSFCSIYAMKSGTVSLNSMFATAGMIIPIIAGIFLFDKPVSPMQFVGLGIFFLSAYILISASRQVYTNFSYKTLLLLIGSTVSNGCTMLAQQMFATYVPDGNVSVFSFLSFGIIAVLGWLLLPVVRVSGANQKSKLSKPLLLCGVALAVAVFVINQLATISTRTVPPAILFTFINGGGTIISTIVAAIVYKEKLSKRTCIGVILGITSLVIIKVFA